MEGDTVSVFWAVCYTNMLKKIVQDKDSQCLCSQDMQKCLRLMENYLPTHILVNIFLHTLQLFHHYMYYYLYILSLVFVLSVVHANDIRRVKQAYSFKTVISSPPRHLLLLFQLWLSLLALSTVFVNGIFLYYCHFLISQMKVLTLGVHCGKCGFTFLSHPYICLLSGFPFSQDS